MQFEITSNSGEAVRVESPNWMMAMGKAMPFFDLDPSAMGRWHIENRADGTVFVADPVTGNSWTLREHRPITVVPSSRSMPLAEDDAPPPRRAPEPRVDPDIPPPRLSMPLQSSLQPPQRPRPAPTPAPAEEPESLGERLFDLSTDIAGARPGQAGRLALELILEFVPCEAASIVRGTLNDVALTFLVASGPVGRQIVGRKVPFGQGVVGLCYDMGITVVVRDAMADDNFLDDVDRETGFETNSLLCAPIVDGQGNVYGVVELINPVEPFQPWHIETVETVAHTLVGPLSA